ncbi:MAG: excisionase family DNA-binding protein, partial [Oceanibaculum nanhaiense]|nr:excisionase family DNA-binding protein [Oceanibaculum nanhaiense]
MKIVEPLEFLTTKELADILRVKERKIYEMAAANEVPFTRVTGKLLFPKALVISWLSRRTELGEDGLALPDPPVVALGSHDPLLDWALRESGSGMASFFDGSLDGFDRFARREGVLCGMHVPAPEAEGWNRHLIEARMPA